MTFQMISQPPMNSLPNSEYIATGTDQAEFEQWMHAQGRDIPDDDITQDLIDMGLG